MTDKIKEKGLEISEAEKYSNCNLCQSAENLIEYRGVGRQTVSCICKDCLKELAIESLKADIEKEAFKYIIENFDKNHSIHRFNACGDGSQPLIDLQDAKDIVEAGLNIQSN